MEKKRKRLPKLKAFKKYNINTFSGSFADWFYLPRKYLTEDLFILFELFALCEYSRTGYSKHGHNIEPNKDNSLLFPGLLGGTGINRLELTIKNIYPVLSIIKK